jgi:hypothetical protein
MVSQSISSFIHIQAREKRQGEANEKEDPYHFIPIVL